MQNKRRTWLIPTVASLVLFSLLLVGCGETAAQDPTPVKTWKITPAATGATGTPGASESATPAPVDTPSANGSTLELVGVSNEFDKEKMSAAAGPITIEFDNQDGGVVHNVAVYPGDDASGEPIGGTDLESGPIEQTLSLTLEAGEYFFQCDAHPTTMKGSLTVE